MRKGKKFGTVSFYMYTHIPFTRWNSRVGEEKVHMQHFSTRLQKMSLTSLSQRAGGLIETKKYIGPLFPKQNLSLFFEGYRKGVPHNSSINAIPILTALILIQQNAYSNICTI